eukprot:TRINITY_DN33532_c0_g1_i1.p1 TRINITY_DN33532_c0_g1~~TRINITY_DN33532_c0_g1_i1.p1  ORF type:complete len:440 (+),score=56.78 TRINITY_DN33532_c0_g1_i1:113-1432(+)
MKPSAWTAVLIAYACTCEVLFFPCVKAAGQNLPLCGNDSCTAEGTFFLQHKSRKVQTFSTSADRKAAEWDSFLQRNRLVSGMSCNQMNLHIAPGLKVRKLKSIQWLHIPKAGTSVLATIWNYACGQKDVLLDLLEPPDVTDLFQERGPCRGWHYFYDTILVSRYPWWKYCEPGLLSSGLTVDYNGAHMSLTEKDHANDVVCFFRNPQQRLISGYYHPLHTAGFNSTMIQVLREKVKNASAYARFPGISGCSARLLTGAYCNDADSTDGGRSRLREALERLKTLSFVGLTDRWDESVCLFHRMFGGRINAGQFKDMHAGPNHHTEYDERQLEGFKDEVDQTIYDAAVTRFEELLKKHVPENQSVCGDLFKEKEGSLGEKATDCSCQAHRSQCGIQQALNVDCGQCPSRSCQMIHTSENVTAAITEESMTMAKCLDHRCVF